MSLRRIKDEPFSSRRRRLKSDSDRNASKTVHPRRLYALQNEKQPSSTEQLIKLVLAQGEVIRRQLKKLRHSEHQIGYLEDKTHKARERKHGKNYLLETYFKGLSEAVDPNLEESPTGDKNSDSGVVTEGSEQSNPNKPTSSVENERFSPSSEELQKNTADDETSSDQSESTLRDKLEVYEMIARLNKKLLKEEECIARLQASIKKYEREARNSNEDVSQALTSLRSEMTKSACEMQHNEIVLEEATEKLTSRKSYLEHLNKDLVDEELEFEMLQALLCSSTPVRTRETFCRPPTSYAKETLDTLV